MKFEFMILGLLTTSLPFPSHLPGRDCQCDSRAAQDGGTTKQAHVAPESWPGIEPPRGSTGPEPPRGSTGPETPPLVFVEPRNEGLL